MSRINNKKENTSYKCQAIIAAMEFGYSQNTIDALRACNDDNKISRIMANARREMN